MNNHKIASIVILVATIAMGYGVNLLRTKAVTARQEMEGSRTRSEQAEQQKKIAEIKLKTVDAKTAELRQIYTEWIPHFEALKSERIGEQRITDVVREGDVFLLSQRFNFQEIDRRDLVSHALVADLVVEDDYTKTMNWLGRLEESIPNMRIAKCDLERGNRGNNIHMTLKLQVPILKKRLSN